MLESVPSNNLRAIRGLVSDMDGVLWRGSQPMPGLAEFFAFLRRAGIRFVLATNNASKTSLEYVERLAGLGVDVSRDEILCAAEATAEHLAGLLPGARIFVIGEPPLEHALAERGLVIVPEEAVQLAAGADGEQADFVVVGWNRSLTWKKLARAAQLIRRGARFVGTNPDRTWPSEFGLLPGNGANLAFLQAATDVDPLIIGKPGKAMFDQALARLGLATGHVAMLGDRLETDIEGGQCAGLTTIFVCSGVNSRDEAECHPAQPDLIYDDIAELMHAWERALA
jgi:4-nitrophenyl phosphatase